MDSKANDFNKAMPNVKIQSGKKVRFSEEADKDLHLLLAAGQRELQSIKDANIGLEKDFQKLNSNIVMSIEKVGQKIKHVKLLMLELDGKRSAKMVQKKPSNKENNIVE